MATIRVDEGIHAASHRLDKALEVALRNTVPFLCNVSLQVSNTITCLNSAEDFQLHNTPGILQRHHVRRLCRPIHACDPPVGQAVSHHMCTMCWAVIIDHDETIPLGAGQAILEWNDVTVDDLSHILLSVESPLQSNNVCFPVVREATPEHDAPATKSFPTVEEDLCMAMLASPTVNSKATVAGMKNNLEKTRKDVFM